MKKNYYSPMRRRTNMNSNLNKAFRALRKAGYFARQNFWCCQTCGWADVPDEAEKVVFYHAQDNEDKLKGRPFYVAWRGDGREICKIFDDNGVTTVWDGSENTRIQISNYI